MILIPLLVLWLAARRRRNRSPVCLTEPVYIVADKSGPSEHEKISVSRVGNWITVTPRNTR